MTEEEKQQIRDSRGYRQFLETYDDGSQKLVTVYRDIERIEVACRPDRWSTWSAPQYMEEIFQ